jgi:hypothetical protein
MASSLSDLTDDDAIVVARMSTTPADAGPFRVALPNTPRSCAASGTMLPSSDRPRHERRIVIFDRHVRTAMRTASGGGDAMEQTLERRVERLEQTVEQQATVRDLAALQTALSVQILQLGSEMRGELSALRSEVKAGDAETRGLIEERTAALLAVVAADSRETREVLRAEIRTGDAETRQQLDQRAQELRAEIRAGDAETRQQLDQRAQELRAEIQAGDAETRRHARMLHEDAIERIKGISRG